MISLHVRASVVARDEELGKSCDEAPFSDGPALASLARVGLTAQAHIPYVRADSLWERSRPKGPERTSPCVRLWGNAHNFWPSR
jgi:hypothetical protein